MYICGSEVPFQKWLTHEVCRLVGYQQFTCLYLFAVTLNSWFLTFYGTSTDPLPSKFLYMQSVYGCVKGTKTCSL
jgi:hypothetical protein